MTRGTAGNVTDYHILDSRILEHVIWCLRVVEAPRCSRRSRRLNSNPDLRYIFSCTGRTTTKAGLAAVESEIGLPSMIQNIAIDLHRPSFNKHSFLAFSSHHPNRNEGHSHTYWIHAVKSCNIALRDPSITCGVALTRCALSKWVTNTRNQE